MQVLQAAAMMAPPPKVIILTSFPTDQHRKIYLRAGAYAFFDKATQFERVVELLVRLCTTPAAQMEQQA